jgi:hypothetical protein
MENLIELLFVLVFLPCLKSFAPRCSLDGCRPERSTTLARLTSVIIQNKKMFITNFVTIHVLHMYRNKILLEQQAYTLMLSFDNSNHCPYIC